MIYEIANAMTNAEIAFMIAACEASDAQENGSLLIGSVDPILAALSQKGLTEKQVWQCEVSLERSGYIEIPGYDRNDVDPAWSRAEVFDISRIGLRWWLIRKYGQAAYSKMVSDVRRTRDECLRNNVMLVADWAERLGLPLLLVQKILHAERYDLG
ncbi:MAG: hypothetical protein ABSH49_18390 [Bryobacteraceae bacterium]